MKKVFIILLLVFSVSLMVDASGAPTSEQVEKLVAVAWKEPPRSIDVTYYGTTKDYTKTEQKFREIYEEVADQMYGPKQNLSPNQLKRRDRMVQMNVKGRLKEKTEGRKVKYRIRFDGDHCRVDKVHGSPARTLVNESGEKESLPGKKIGADTPFETTSIEMRDNDYGYSRCELSHTKQIAKMRKIEDRQKFENSRLMSFVMIPHATLIKMKLGSNESGSYKPNETKIEQLKLGTLDSIDIDIRPDEDAPGTRDKIELQFYTPSKQAIIKSMMICSKQDYSVVYSYEARNPASGDLTLERRANNFDAQGFPHNFIEIKYDDTGQIQFSEEFEIESVHLNIQIPPEDFEFAPPKDYKVTDLRKTPDERQVAEVARLKGWLKDENWTRRYRALTRLKELMKDKPAEFKEIATSMLNDKQPQVRMAAESVLQSLESSQ